MKKLLLIVSVLMLFQSVNLKGQMAGTEAYLKGNYVEVGVAGDGGFEGADTAVGARPAGMHFRSGNPYFGIVANPQVNGWATFNGDYFTPGSPENGWGFEIGATGGATGSNNCTQSGIFGTGPQIPGALTYSYSAGIISATWNGDYTTGTNLHFKIQYVLGQNDLYYTTVVSVTNNTASTIPDFYYYKNMDPDDNQPISSSFTTMNKIVAEPNAFSQLAQVTATQYPSALMATAPWFTYIGLAAIGANWRANMGGFSNFDASDIWYGTGTYLPAFDQIVGDSLEQDAAISLAYRIQNLAAGATETFQFYTVFDGSINISTLPSLNLNLSFPGSTSATYNGVDTITICTGSTVPVSVTGPASINYTWAWSPATGLSTTSGISVVANPTVTTTYTVIGTPISGSVTPDTMAITVIVSSGGAIPVITPVGDLCIAGAPITLTADSVGGVWSGMGITNTTAGTFDPSTAGLGTHIISYTTLSGCGATDTLSITVDSLASVHITASTTHICSAIPVTFSATNINGGTTPSYQWQWNGANVGTDSVNYTTHVLSNGDVIRCIMTSSSPICGGTVTSNIITMIVTPIATPYITVTGSLVSCVGGSVTLTASTIVGGTYLWSTGQTTQSITVTTTGVYSVTENSSPTCYATSAPYVLGSMAAVLPICMITVDSASTHNIVVWEKTGVGAQVDSFVVYREVMTSVYSRIATIPNDTFTMSEYHDYGANPNVTSYKYKLAAKDTCGGLSPASNYHNSIHLQYLGGGNLQWTLYDIELAGNPVTYYIIERDDAGTGNFLPISSTIPGTNYTYTDINFASYPSARYRVNVTWSISCHPSTHSPLVTTISNIIALNPSAVAEVDLSNAVSIFPNPTTGEFKVTSSKCKVESVKVFNVLGECIFEKNYQGTAISITIPSNTSSPSGRSGGAGIYFVQIVTDKGIVNRKLVKE